MKLQGNILSDPFPADLNADGYLEILVETTLGMEAFSSSGTIVTDWPFETPTDSLAGGYRRFNRGIGGDGFACAPLRDGRVSCGTPPAPSPSGTTPLAHRYFTDLKATAP